MRRQQVEMLRARKQLERYFKTFVVEHTGSVSIH